LTEKVRVGEKEDDDVMNKESILFDTYIQCKVLVEGKKYDYNYTKKKKETKWVQLIQFGILKVFFCLKKISISFSLL